MGYYKAGIASGMTPQKIFSGISSSIAAIYDFTQLQTSTTNRQGTLNGSNLCTGINSVLPGPVGITMSPAGTNPPWAAGALTFGTATDDHFKQASATSDFNFTYVNATPANLKWTAFFVANLSTDTTWQSVFGNSGLFSPNGGVSIFYDFGSGNSKMAVAIDNTTGGGTSVCLWFSPNGGVTLNTWRVYCVQVDFSLAQNAGRVQSWNGNSAQTATSTGSGTPMTASTGVEFYLGDSRTFGNADMQGSMKFFAILSGVESSTVRQQIMERISKYTGVAL
jgi:hypothetical protein